jgi:hypothetical protein
VHKPDDDDAVVHGQGPASDAPVDAPTRANGHLATIDRPALADLPPVASRGQPWVSAGNREAWLVMFGIASIVLLYAWSGQFWVDLVDEGYFLDLSQRVLNGALPYRDFSTYYTPGIFYLFAAAFKVFGTNLLVIRYLMAVVRGLCALLLYVLTRRVAPWPLAWLPFILIFLFDAWPIEPEPHPSWPSLVACLVTLECLVRHLTTRRVRWLALAGAAAGVAYLFKQNIGAFTAIGVGGYVLLRPRFQPSAWLRAAQVGFVLATVALVTLVMREGMDPLFFGGLWLPVVVILGLLLQRAIRGSPEAEGSWLLDGLVSAASFSLVTAAWLIPLVISLGPGQTPIGLFVGEVNQASIATAFASFTPGIPPLLLAAIWLTTLVVSVRGGWRWRPLAIALALTAVVLVLPIWQGPHDGLTQDSLFRPILGWLDVNFGTLCLYLPSMAVWAGIGGLIVFGSRVGPHAYYVLFGGLTSLTMYPRADVLHAIVSSPVALIGATAALAQVCRKFSGWQRSALMATFLLVPAAAVAPQVVWRVATVVSPENTGQRLDYVPLDIASAPVLEPRLSAQDMRDVVTYVDDATPPGQPVFVYPVAPLLNFLANRPNPTRFDHFLPGTLTDQDLDEVISDLQQARPRYVIWDDFGVHVWQTDPVNRPLSDYIWRCYHEVTAFHPYLVLERDADAC